MIDVHIMLPKSLVDSLKVAARVRGVAFSEFLRWILIGWDEEKNNE